MVAIRSDFKIIQIPQAFTLRNAFFPAQTKIPKTESERKYFSYAAMVKIVGSGSNYPGSYGRATM